MAVEKPDLENQDGRPFDPASGSPIRRVLGWTALLIIFILCAAGGWLAVYAYSPTVGNHDQAVLIPKGAGVREIETVLARNHVLNKDIRFLLLARLSDTAGRLQAGEYLIPPHQTPLQILHLLQSGNVIKHMVTIPEGLTLQQVANLLAKEGWVDHGRFLALTTNQNFIRTLGLDLPSLEGYLFPDTYQLTRVKATEKSIIGMMVCRFLAVWEKITIGVTMQMTRNQIITLASIVEKETGNPMERPLIARVFLNRLQRGMRLQSDPTVIYGLKDFNGNLTHDDLKKDTAYNTYLISGLPPGPICNPGEESIAAVLHPAESSSLYFVSKNDGTHYFSTTLREHNRAVRKYQSARPRQAARTQELSEKGEAGK